MDDIAITALSVIGFIVAAAATYGVGRATYNIYLRRRYKARRRR
jgi:hypothetical protein